MEAVIAARNAAASANTGASANPGDPAAMKQLASAEGTPAAEVVVLLATSVGIDVASEDPEFYAWLAAQDLPAANGAG
jgi:hypothetical protein